MTTSGGYGELATSRTPNTAPLGGDRPAIVTPDAVGLDVEVATVGSRGAAYLVDLVAFLTVLFVLTVAQAVLGGAGFVPGWLAIAILLVLTFAWQFGYPIGFETLWRGRTPGKALLGLRVVTVEGAPIGVRHASIRAVIGIFELLGTLGAPAIVSSLLSSRSQRLGDLAAGTMVVRERVRPPARPRGLRAPARRQRHRAGRLRDDPRHAPPGTAAAPVDRRAGHRRPGGRPARAGHAGAPTRLWAVGLPRLRRRGRPGAPRASCPGRTRRTHGTGGPHGVGGSAWTDDTASSRRGAARADGPPAATRTPTAG